MSGNTLFLFGAGASKGAIYVKPAAPPIGSGVYDALVRESPRVWGPGTMFGDHADGLRKDFEKAMSRIIWGQDMNALTYLEPSQSMALFFAKFAPDGPHRDFYSRLISFLKVEEMIQKTVFASINYDCIFEQAARNRGFEVDYDFEALGRNRVCVLKVHGSCNFITEDMRDQRQHLVSTNMSVETDKIEYVPLANLSDALMTRFSAPNSIRYPVMCAYADVKFSYVASGKIAAAENRWRKSASEAALVVIIGVRPNEHDIHICEPIKETRAKVFYIGGRESMRGWKSINKRTRWLGRTFGEGFHGLQKVLSRRSRWTKWMSV